MPQFDISQSHLAHFANQASLTLACWQVMESEAELAALLPAHYGYADEARQRFRSARRRCEWLAARVLLHVVCGETARLDYAPDGRPILSNTRCVSISHTRDYVALLLAPCSAGLDIEVYGARALALRSRFLSSAEQDLFDTSLSAFPAETAAVMLWTAKEAAFKALAPQGATYITQVELQPAAARRNLTQLTATYAASTVKVALFCLPQFAGCVAVQI